MEDEQRRSLQWLREKRKRNLRQLLQGLSRVVNARILNGLASRGYHDVRLAHTMVLSNVDFEGTSISAVADRANMTVQGISQLASDLETLGYVERRIDESDGRSRIISFTRRGWKLMMDSFEIMDEIERDFGEILGRRRVGELRSSLSTLITSSDQAPRRGGTATSTKRSL